MRLSVTSRRPGGVGQPPARLRGTMGNGPTGQTRSSNPPPACGAACARVRRSRFGVWLHGKPHSAQPVGSECAFPSRRDRRMRLSVRVPAQNAPFRRVRLSSPGQTWRRLTEKRILDGRRHGKAHFTCGPHQKAHSVCDRSRRMRLSVRIHAQNALFRRMRLSSSGQTRRRLTEKRILQPWCYQKAHFATPPEV